MYIDDILALHENKQIGVYTKSGACFRGYLSKVDDAHHIIYLSKEMSGDWLTIVDTRNIESIQIAEEQLHKDFAELIHKE